MIASAAARQPPAAPSSARAPRILVILPAGSGSPITPVEARNTSPGLQPTMAAADSATSRAPSRPCLPVQASELPLLPTNARAVPEPRLALHHSTGAEAVR